MNVRNAMLAALGILVGVTATGCGDPPTDAAEEEFCAVASRFPLTAGASEAEMIAAMNQWAEDLKEVGTPDDISEKARLGFEQQVDTYAEFDSEVEQYNYPLDVYADEKNPGSAYAEYVAATCG